jgi:hypothetical protein
VDLETMVGIERPHDDFHALKIWIYLYFKSHLKGELISFLSTFLEVLLSHLCPIQL